MEEKTYDFLKNGDNGTAGDTSKPRTSLRVMKIFTEKNAVGGSIVYYYIVKQGTDVPKNFTMRYAFTRDYIDVVQLQRNVYTYVCSRELYGSSMLIKLHVPESIDVSNCVAYISEYETEDEIVQCQAAPAQAKNGDLLNLAASTPVTEVALDPEGETVRYIPDIPVVQSSRKTSDGDVKSKITIAAATLIFIVAAVLFGMIVLNYANRVNYDNTIAAARLLSEVGLNEKAEYYAEDRLKGNKYYEAYRTEISELTESLLKEKRYNEAFSIINITPFASELQHVCEVASADYASLGDYKNAYAYAYAAPNPFVEEIVDAALEDAFDSETMTFNPDAYSVAVSGSVNDSKTDELIHRIIDAEIEKKNYITALDTAVMLKDEKDDTAYNILETAVNDAVKRDKYDEAEYYLDTYSGVENCNMLAQKTFSRIYEQAMKDKDYDTAGEYARKYKYNFSGSITVSAEDRDIRKSLAHSYFQLSESQKRTYHSNKIAVSNVLTANIGGRVRVNEHGKTKIINDVASIASGDMFTAILHTNGKTELFSRLSSAPDETYSGANDLAVSIEAPKSGTVDIAAGEKHLVFLMANGSVISSGDNSCGQCGTGEWKDIVAIAAGADFTVGLKSDGTLVACGSNKCGQCSLEGYHNVVDVRACRQSTVLLFRDGTVKIAGERSRGLLVCDGWSNISRIRAGANAVMAETNDGKYIFAGYISDDSEAKKVTGLSGLSDFEVGDSCIAYIKGTGGTCYTIGYSIQKQQ